MQLFLIIGSEDDDLSDFLAETEDVVSNSKYGKNSMLLFIFILSFFMILIIIINAARDRDDAMEKSYDDDVNWDDVMEV